MADHASNLSASASIGASASASATASGFFSRRPSFFSSTKGSSKGHQNKASRSSVSYSSHSYHRTNAASPPALILPPAPSSTPAPDETPHEPGQYDSNPIQPTTPHHRRHASRHSIASSVTDIGSSLRRSRSNSVRTNTSGGTASTSSHKRTPSANLALTYSPKRPQCGCQRAPTHPLHIHILAEQAKEQRECKGRGRTKHTGLREEPTQCG
ncbi:hypothetical protein JI435_417540 [Parastagonospora nodorum SN15]|uniref:Uncharacterized protein n=1 Tax=Phaeosphaeria nodorum (strain SN15 / ATCC MYA-4574 / FGSC 10173) TaxID=321614 RepID=A0A7U2I557_PHANO|nr:hypothetical protein JI435_417540 [Parastagonospora nodorum SN15]